MNARTSHSVLLDPSAEAALSTRGDKPNSSSSIRTRRNGALDPRGAKKALCNRGLERKRARSRAAENEVPRQRIPAARPGRVLRYAGKSPRTTAKIAMSSSGVWGYTRPIQRW